MINLGGISKGFGMAGDSSVQKRIIYEKLGDTDFQRKMAAERIFRQLRRGERNIVQPMMPLPTMASAK